MLARVGAPLAMFRFVFPAFCAAGVAHVGAQSADLLHEVRTATHESRRAPANFGTIPVQPYTLGHHLDISLAQARIRTVFAGLSTLDAGFDAALVFLVAHGVLRLSLLHC
jgi:hypothetical protein